MRFLVSILGIITLLSIFAATTLAQSHTTQVRVRSVLAILGETKIQTIDTPLGDIANQLKHLPFTSFKLLEDRTEHLSMKNKEVLRLTTGDTLSIRPLYTEGGKVCLWLRWVDGHGVQVLDTRLHVEPGKSLLAGTDAADNRAIVLAVGVVPESHE